MNHAQDRRWTVTTYDLRQMIGLCRGDYFAVFADGPNNDGEYTLRADPLDALGLAMVTRRDMVERHGVTTEICKSFSTEVVGLMLLHGQLGIVQEYANFGGMVERDGDIRFAVDYLPDKVVDALADEFKVPLPNPE